MNFHALHQKTKLTILFTVYGFSFIYPPWYVFLLTIPVLFVLHITHQTLKTWFLALLIVLPYLGMLLLINGILVPPTQEVWFQLYTFTLSPESVQATLTQTKSVVSLVFVLLTLFKHTSLHDLLSSFQSSWVRMMIVLGFLILNTVKEATESLKDLIFIQQTRSTKVSFTFFDRIKGLLPLMMPTLNRQMMMSQHRQLSYALRGFQLHQMKTSYHCVSRFEKGIISMTFLLIIVLLGLEGFPWL